MYASHSVGVFIFSFLLSALHGVQLMDGREGEMLRFGNK